MERHFEHLKRRVKKTAKMSATKEFLAAPSVTESEALRFDDCFAVDNEDWALVVAVETEAEDKEEDGASDSRFS